MTEAPTIHTADLLVGARVRLRRKQLEVSQTDLAKICGITFQQIQKYERGANRISASKLYEIAKHLKVSMSYFFLDLPEPEVEDAPSPHSRALTEAMFDPIVLDTIVALGSMSSAERAFIRSTTLAMRKMHTDVWHDPEVASPSAPRATPDDKIDRLAKGPIDGVVTIWYGTFASKAALLAKIKKVGGTEWTTISDTGKSYTVRKIAEPSPA